MFCFRRTLHAILLLLCLLSVSCVSTESERTTDYIPKDLADAHTQLAKLLSAKEISHIKAMKKEEDMVKYHMGLGMTLRNSWGLWGRSRLARYFNRLGIDHPDDMSAIILKTFWCKLHQKPFKLERRIASYQEYWNSMERPRGGSPKDGAEISWLVIKGEGRGTVHLGISLSDQSRWRYEYGSGRGIEPATKAERKELGGR